jgi:hypothetical protein
MDDGETEAEPAGDILPPEEEEITGTWPLRPANLLTASGQPISEAPPYSENAALPAHASALVRDLKLT